ncbi:MAG TPA: PmoA family protein [Hanamia sp.]
MKYLIQSLGLSLLAIACFSVAFAQKQEKVKLVKSAKENKIDIFIGDKLFTTFMYPDNLEKPVLYPVHAANGTVVTRGFPLNTQPNDPTDHPHHLGIWFNFENVNGLDFWNNSFAIPKEKKHLYGWIHTDKILKTSGGTKGVLSYHANWTNQQKRVLLEESTRLEFSGTKHQRIIDRVTVLKADTTVTFTDAKDGMLAIRLAHALQIPTNKDQQFKDDKGNVTVVKGGADNIPTGNYITSEGKQGDEAWSTRARWCKVYGKMGNDSISITIIDHPENINYPTFWHARGYGLFAANPLGERIFTNGKTFKDLQLKKGESVTFRFRIIVDEGSETISSAVLNKLADEFGKKK